MLRKDCIFQNSNDVTVTSFLNQSQHSFIIFLEIPDLSKIGLFLVPWKHILETALMRNGAIQLSNDVTVTLFLHQSLQNFELFLEMISSNSLQSFNRKKCFILKWQHILLRSWATVSLVHKFTSLTQDDEENRTRQNTVIYYK